MSANFQQLANFIWSVADLLRGPYRPPQYERVMLPLTVLRRFDGQLCLGLRATAVHPPESPRIAAPVLVSSGSAFLLGKLPATIICTKAKAARDIDLAAFFMHIDE